MQECFKLGDLITNHKESYKVFGIARYFNDALGYGPIVKYAVDDYKAYFNMKTSYFNDLEKLGFFTYYRSDDV